jgi:hypothetical protein
MARLALEFKTDSQ